MNKWLPAFLLFISPLVLSGCIFGKKTHATAKAANTDSTIVVTIPSPFSEKIASKPDGVFVAHTDTARKLHTDTTVANTKTNSAHVAANNLSVQQVASANALWHRPFPYTTFEAKAKMHYEGNGSGQDFTANFRIKKDSVIWVAVSALGGMLSVARAYITPDSIKVVNYLSKEVILMPIGQANKLLPAPVDFSILQNLITGQPLLGSGNVNSMADSVLTWMISFADSSYLGKLTYTKADSTLGTQQIATITPGPIVAIQQSGYIRDEDKHFSRSRAVQIDNNGALYELDMDFTSQSFNKQLDFPFSFSSKYTINPSK